LTIYELSLNEKLNKLKNRSLSWKKLNCEPIKMFLWQAIRNWTKNYKKTLRIAPQNPKTPTIFCKMSSYI
jgi:uncharacterized protein YlaI